MDPACEPNLYCQVCDGCAHGHCELIDQNDITQCAYVVPPSWTCSHAAYGDAVCDCGCGAPDPVCHDITLASCQSCNSAGSCSTLTCDDPQSRINPTDNEACLR
jgi:hypothetical protein